MTRGYRFSSRSILNWEDGSAFHRDDDFNDTLDGLVLVDLPQSNRRLLEFYLGRNGADKYLSYHRQEEFVRGEWSGSGGLPPQPAQEWQPAAS